MIRAARLRARRRAGHLAAARRAEAAHLADVEAAMDRLILRDLLAIERTKLANERTVLSYVRTGFACLAGALTLFQLFATPASRWSALALAVAGLALFVLGARRYRLAGRLVQGYARRGNPPDPAAPPGG